MGNVIEKSFSILEQIVSSAPEPCLPSPLAERLNLNRATCSRLLKQLTDMGYLLKVSRLQGYVAGPKLLTLNNIAGFERELLKAANPVIDRCAETLECSVLLARLYGRKRYVLYHRNCASDLNIRITQPCYDDLFCTATGLLLTSHLPEEEILACWQEQKKAGAEIMPEYRFKKNLIEQLEKISERGYFDFGKDIQWIYSYPVFRNGTFYAALGASIHRSKHTPAYHRNVCKVLKQAADEISRSLSPRYTIA